MSWVYHMFHPFTIKFYILFTFWWLRKKFFCMYYTLLDTIASSKDKWKTFMPLPIFVTQICKEWMLEDEFNHAIKDKISIQAETVSSSYNASVQIDWVPSMLQDMSPLHHDHLMNRKRMMMNSLINNHPKIIVHLCI